MNRNQFFYTRTAQLETGETVSFKDSLNVELIIRSLELEDGQVLVLLNDVHERMLEVPVYNKKGDKQLAPKKERQTVQTEIYLSKIDGERFFKLTNIEE